MKRCVCGHTQLAHIPETSIDFYKILLTAFWLDQYAVPGLTNCLADFKLYNKTLKYFKTFDNVVQRRIYKGSHGLLWSQTVIPACFEMNESSAG